jgi:hypothetical protein
VFHGTLAELAALITSGGDMPLSAADIEAVAKAVWTVDGIIPAPDGNKANPFWQPQRALSDAGVQSRAMEATIRNGLAALQGTDGTPEQIAEAIATDLGPEIGQQVVTALQARLAASAPA